MFRALLNLRSGRLEICTRPSSAIQQQSAWVAEEHRGKGLGSALLGVFERHAIDKGCKIAFLSSHSFQSPDFYKRLGYEEQASIKDYPVDHADVFFAKRLAPGAA